MTQEPESMHFTIASSHSQHPGRGACRVRMLWFVGHIFLLGHEEALLFTHVLPSGSRVLRFSFPKTAAGTNTF